MKDDYLFCGYSAVSLRPACRQAIPSSIRGFSLPREYIVFLSNHDGGSLIYDMSLPDLDDVRHVELFSLGEVLEGTYERDSFGRYLGSELTMREDFQNTRLGVRTTANNTPYDEAIELFKQFYQNYLVIGYAWVYWDEPIRRISLLGIDRNGTFIISDDEHIEYGLHEAWRGMSPVVWRGASFKDLLEQARNSV